MTCNDFKSKGNWLKTKKNALSIQYLCSKAALSMCFRTWYLMHCAHCSKQWVGAYMGTHHISGHLWQMFFTCLRTFYNSALTVWLRGTNSWCMALSVVKKQLTCLWSHFMIWWAAFRLWYCGIFHCKFPFGSVVAIYKIYKNFPLALWVVFILQAWGSCTVSLMFIGLYFSGQRCHSWNLLERLTHFRGHYSKYSDYQG